MRDDCTDQYHTEGLLCRQRPSRRKALYRISEGQGSSVSGGRSLHLGVETHQSTHAHARFLLKITPKVKEQRQTLVPTVQCSRVVHTYRTQRARP